VLIAFRDFLRREVGEDAVWLLDRRLDCISLRQLASDQGFGIGGWALRRLIQRVREAALAFARRQGEVGLVRAVERLLPTSQEHVEEASGWWILAGQAV
jgi:GNAT superfamily N-acetyltransferase